MELYYENHRGVKLDFTKPPYLARDISELPNFDKSYSITNNQLNLETQPGELPITINVLADTKEEYDNACDFLHETMEQDALLNKQGKIYFNGQYVLCTLVGSVKKDWCMGVDFQLNYLRFVAVKPFWIKETEYHFKTASVTSTGNKQYPYKYPYRYANGMKDSFVINEHIAPVHFKLRIYGTCANPFIVIGGHTYRVQTILETGEYLEIDSVSETVIKTKVDGTKVNVFHYRSEDCFKKILPGRRTINWPGQFDFDLILYEERSEPKWQTNSK
ncbi:phage tail protein [Faecalimonas sp.]